MTNYRIVSWNVNGYSDKIHAQVLQMLKEDIDILFLSETHQKETTLIDYLGHLDDYYLVVNSHEPARWHGVLMLIKKTHTLAHLNLQIPIRSRKDCNKSDPMCGRLIMVKINNQLNIIASYTPNSGHDQVSEKYLYRINTWDTAFFNVLQTLKDEHTLVVGDLNCAPQEIDVSHPQRMKNYAGFTPKERENFNKLLIELQYVDIWRHLHSDAKGYTWLGTASGMRLDHILVSPSVIDSVKTCEIAQTGTISDHLPLQVKLIFLPDSLIFDSVTHQFAIATN